MMEFGIVRLDRETKIALIAALVYDGDAQEAVTVACEIDQLVHDRPKRRE